jgi:LysW-gamma-L-lysine carboxypeptidase
MNDAETLIGLVRQYSPSGEEGRAVRWLVDRMQTLRFTRVLVDAAGNAIGVMGTGPQQVLLLGHIDTVPGEIPVREEAGTVYGRGAVDAKGALSCFVDAVASLGPVAGWQFVVVGAVEEERESEGARFVASAYRPEFLIVGEPNRWDRVALGYKGSAWAWLTVERSLAHTASARESASEAAVKVWQAVERFAAEFNQGREAVFDRILVTLRAMESGGDGFKEWARIKVGARLPLDFNPQDWYTRLERIAEGARMESIGHAMPAYRCEKNTVLVRSFLNGIRVSGGKPNFVFKSGSSDLNIVNPIWKVPALVYGPGDSALDHTPEERLSLDEYRKSVSVLAAALMDLMTSVSQTSTPAVH